MTQKNKSKINGLPDGVFPGDVPVQCNRCPTKWWQAPKTPETLAPAYCDKYRNGLVAPTTTAPRIQHPPLPKNHDPNYDWINYLGNYTPPIVTR
jgi:hypothetical protein